MSSIGYDLLSLLRLQLLLLAIGLKACRFLVKRALLARLLLLAIGLLLLAIGLQFFSTLPRLQFLPLELSLFRFRSNLQFSQLEKERRLLRKIECRPPDLGTRG